MAKLGDGKTILNLLINLSDCTNLRVWTQGLAFSSSVSLNDMAVKDALWDEKNTTHQYGGYGEGGVEEGLCYVDGGKLSLHGETIFRVPLANLQR